MRRSQRFLTAILAVLALSGTAAVAQQAAGNAEPGGVSFQTLDGDVQQVDVGEIWRIRASAGNEEPDGAVLIDYAFERLFVKEGLQSVIDKLGEKRHIVRFTLPSGMPVYVVAEKVIGITRAMQGQHHPKSKSLIVAREGQQQVQETREAVREALRKE
jgi:hypothetical protein